MFLYNYFMNSQWTRKFKKIPGQKKLVKSNKCQFHEKKFRDINLLDFTSFFGLDFFKKFLALYGEIYVIFTFNDFPKFKTFM